jgi:hypothetical protein
MQGFKNDSEHIKNNLNSYNVKNFKWIKINIKRRFESLKIWNKYISGNSKNFFILLL